MDVMMRFADNEKSAFLSKDDLRAKARFIFAKEPTKSVSQKYVFANTETVIDDMAKMGWGVVDAKQQKSKMRANGIASFHMVAFQNPDIAIYKTDEQGEFVTDEYGNKVVDSYPRIILTNSHDGNNSFVFRIGIFRLICSNGLVVSTQEFECRKVRHINYSFDDLRRVVIESVQRVGEQVIVMSEMKRRILSENEISEFATQALKIRKGEDYKVEESAIKEVLVANRKEDESTDLWTIFNRVQENLVHGHFSTSNAKGKVRKARPIKSIAKDIEVNTRLFQLANTYRAVA